MRPGDVLEGWTLRACLAPGPLARWDASRDDGREGHVLVAADEQAVEELARMRAALARMRGMGVPALFGHEDRWVAHASPPGEPLTRWIAASRSVVEVLDVAASLAEVLAAAHAHGCAHGMLGGDDIVVDDDACVTVLGLRAEEGPAAMAEDAWALGALLLGALREVSALGLSGAGAQDVFAAVRARDARLGGVLVSLLAARPRERATCAQVVGPLRASGRAAGEGMGLAAEPEGSAADHGLAADAPVAIVAAVEGAADEERAEVEPSASVDARDGSPVEPAVSVTEVAPPTEAVSVASALNVPTSPDAPDEAFVVEAAVEQDPASPSLRVPLPVPPAEASTEADEEPSVAEAASPAEDDVSLDLDAWFDAPGDEVTAQAVAVPSPLEADPLATETSPPAVALAPAASPVVAPPPSPRTADREQASGASRVAAPAPEGARRVIAVPRAGTPLIARPHPYPRIDRALDVAALVALAVHVGLALAVLWLHFT